MLGERYFVMFFYCSTDLFALSTDLPSMYRVFQKKIAKRLPCFSVVSFYFVFLMFFATLW